MRNNRKNGRGPRGERDDVRDDGSDESEDTEPGRTIVGLYLPPRKPSSSKRKRDHGRHDDREQQESFREPVSIELYISSPPTELAEPGPARPTKEDRNWERSVDSFRLTVARWLRRGRRR